jgi:hypothetical protein
MRFMMILPGGRIWTAAALLAPTRRRPSMTLSLDHCSFLGEAKSERIASRPVFRAQ